MSIISAASVKSSFGNTQVPTQTDHENLIDTAIREPLIAIASAGEAGRTGFIEILATAQATVVGGTVGLPFVGAASVTARRQLLAKSFGVTFMDAETTAAGRSLLNIISDTTNPVLNDFTNVSAVGGSAQSLVLQGTTWTAATAQGVTAAAVIVDATATNLAFNYVVWPNSVVEFWGVNRNLGANSSKSISLPSVVSAAWSIVVTGFDNGTNSNDVYLQGFDNSNVKFRNEKGDTVDVFIEGVGDKV